MDQLPHEVLAQIALYLPPAQTQTLQYLCKALFQRAEFRSFAFAVESLNRNADVSSNDLPPLFLAAALCLSRIEVVPIQNSCQIARVLCAHQSHPLVQKRWTVISAQLLKVAAEKGNLGLAKIVVTEMRVGVDVVVENDSPTALGLASYNGHTDIVKLLLKYGANPKSIGNDSDKAYCPLNLATQGGHSDIMKLLLESGADPDQRDYGNWTSLHWAAELDETDLCAILLDYGAFIDAGDQQNRTPLHWAVSRNQSNVVKFLVNRGADTALVTSARSTCLHLAAANGCTDVIKYLLEQNNFDVNARDETNRTPLHSASDDGHEDICKVLLEAGANVTLADDNNYSPLHVACSNNHIMAAQGLISTGNASLLDKTILGNTPLHFAVASDDADILIRLLCTSTHELKLILTTQNFSHHTPLQHAACLGVTKSVETLLPMTLPFISDILPQTPQEYATSPLHLAIRFNHVQTSLAIIPFAKEHWPSELFNSAIDYTIECFLSLRPYSTSTDRDVARALVAHGAVPSGVWEVGCTGCGADKIVSPFYRCMVCEGVVYCGGCRSRVRWEAGFHDMGHAFFVGDQVQLLDFLVSEAEGTTE